MNGVCPHKLWFVWQSQDRSTPVEDAAAEEVGVAFSEVLSEAPPNDSVFWVCVSFWSAHISSRFLDEGWTQKEGPATNHSWSSRLRAERISIGFRPNVQALGSPE